MKLKEDVLVTVFVITPIGDDITTTECVTIPHLEKIRTAFHDIAASLMHISVVMTALGGDGAVHTQQCS